MTTSKPFKTFLSKLYKSSGWALFTMFIWELVEEGLENLIALMITSAFAIFIAKVLSTLAIVISTQGIKTLIKSCLFPSIRKIIHKEGNDKLNKVVNFFKWIFANKKTLTGIASTAVFTLSGTGVIDVAALPALIIDGFNLTPILYYGALLILSIIGVTGKGFETIKAFFARKQTETAEKEAQKLVKEAQKQITTEQKAAKQAEAKTQAEQAKKAAIDEHNKKVEEVKAKLIAESKNVNNA